MEGKKGGEDHNNRRPVKNGSVFPTWHKEEGRKQCACVNHFLPSTLLLDPSCERSRVQHERDIEPHPVCHTRQQQQSKRAKANTPHAATSFCFFGSLHTKHDGDVGTTVVHLLSNGTTRRLSGRTLTVVVGRVVCLSSVKYLTRSV